MTSLLVYTGVWDFEHSSLDKIPIGILLNYQTIQVYSVCCITMRQTMALCYTTLFNGVINRICAWMEPKLKICALTLDETLHPRLTVSSTTLRWRWLTSTNISAQRLIISWGRTATVPSRIRNASSDYTAYESFAPLTLIIPFCPCFINRVSRVF